MSNIRGLFDGLAYLIDDGRAFVASTGDLSNPSSVEVAKILIKNPTGSGKKLKIFKIEETTTTSTGNTSFRYYRGSTITVNGSAMEKNNLLEDGLVSVMQIFVNPTVTVNGTKIISTLVGQMDTLIKEQKWLHVLHEGENLVVNIRTNASGTFYNYNIYWVEV